MFYREDETVEVFQQGIKTPMLIKDVVFKVQEHQKKILTVKGNKDIVFDRSYLDLGLQIEGLNIWTGKVCLEPFRDIRAGDLKTGLQVFYTVGGVDRSVLLPEDCLVLDAKYKVVTLEENAVLFGGVTIRRIAKQGKFRFIQIRPTVINNIKKFDIFIVKT